jgi:hypothetical protein
MAVSSATSWSDTTAIEASSGAARVKSVRAVLNPEAVAASYVQLYNAAATPGTTAPNVVLELPINSRNKTVSFPFPNGLYFDTAVNWFVSTTHDGGTAASTSAPLQVAVHYAPGN